MMKKVLLGFGIIIPVMLIGMIPVGNTVDDELLKVGREYRSYPLYNTHDYWTLTLCAPYYGPGMVEDTLHISQAPMKSPHGNNLYKLYVKDKEAYHKKLDEQPVGQVVIKEVWSVREVAFDNDSIKENTLAVMRSFNDGKYYTPSSRKQLFIMYKTKPAKGNADGWWYGIVDMEKGTDHMRVIESMKINRCMKCHEEAKKDRMLGTDDGPY
jgi:hypothetical protein